MWIAGTLALLVAGTVVAVALGWQPRESPNPPQLNVPAIASIYTGVVGTLAGFSIASAFFIAGLNTGAESPRFATLVGMLLVSFFILMSAAMIYGTLPNRKTLRPEDVGTQAFPLVLANAGCILGSLVSWFALRPLLQIIELTALAADFTWVLLAVLIAGSTWLALSTYRLTTARIEVCLAAPALGIGLPALYWLVIAPRWPMLLPARDPALHYAYVAFGLAALLFAVQLGLFLVTDSQKARKLLQQTAHRLAIAVIQLVAITVGMVWFAVALS